MQKIGAEVYGALSPCLARGCGLMCSKGKPSLVFEAYQWNGSLSDTSMPLVRVWDGQKSNGNDFKRGIIINTAHHPHPPHRQAQEDTPRFTGQVLLPAIQNILDLIMARPFEVIRFSMRAVELGFLNSSDT